MISTTRYNTHMPISSINAIYCVYYKTLVSLADSALSPLSLCHSFPCSSACAVIHP